MIGSKPREVFTYVYNHTEVLDNLVRHVNQKSIAEVLIRLLNVSENVFEGKLDMNVDTIRQSFAFKVVQRLSPQFDIEDHMNASSLLAELVEFK